MYASITLSDKKYVHNKVYALNKQVSKDMVMLFFSNNTTILSFVLTGYGFILPCMHFVYLALLDHSTSDYAKHNQSVAWPVLKSDIQGSDFVFL